MDRQDLARINGNTATALQQAVPQGWLPFVDDKDLTDWRDWLLEQLRPGQHIQTAEVFAQRMGITADEMEALKDAAEVTWATYRNQVAEEDDRERTQ